MPEQFGALTVRGKCQASGFLSQVSLVRPLFLLGGTGGWESRDLSSPIHPPAKFNLGCLLVFGSEGEVEPANSKKQKQEGSRNGSEEKHPSCLRFGTRNAILMAIFLWPACHS